MQAERRATLATEQAQDSAGGSVPAERAQASWRGTLRIHPACELIPPMSADEVRDLGENILKNGLISPIALWLASKNAQAQLLDGRSRLDALELALGRPVRVTSRTFRGRTTWSLEADDDAGKSVPVCNLIGEEGFPFGTKLEFDIAILDSDTDPYEYVKSANIHRRHLTAEKKREAIANLIKATPGKSDRQIAKTAKASPTFVGKVRAEMEAKGEVSPRWTPGPTPRASSSRHGRPGASPRPTPTRRSPPPRAGRFTRPRNNNNNTSRGGSTGRRVASAEPNSTVNAGPANKGECESLRARIDEQQTSIDHFVSQNGELRRPGAEDLEARQKPITPDSIATLSDAELTEALTALGFERFLQVVPTEWGSKLAAAAKPSARGTASQLVDTLESRLRRDGIEAAAQLRKLRDRINQHKPKIDLKVVPAMGAA